MVWRFWGYGVKQTVTWFRAHVAEKYACNASFFWEGVYIDMHFIGPKVSLTFQAERQSREMYVKPCKQNEQIPFIILLMFQKSCTTWGCKKSIENGINYNINWCRISAINRWTSFILSLFCARLVTVTVFHHFWSSFFRSAEPFLPMSAGTVRYQQLFEDFSDIQQGRW